MNADKIQMQEAVPRVFQSKKNDSIVHMEDNRAQSTLQARLIETLQRAPEDEEDLLQGKFVVQGDMEEEEDLLQGKFVAQRDMEDEDDLLQGKLVAQRDMEDEDDLLQGKFVAQRKAENQTGIPDEVKQRMESSFDTDFSSVRVHPDSSKAPDVGALAFTQGTDIHFAPGQFKPDTASGQQLLGHELTHVIQQAEGRVRPTTEIAGMSVNDDVSLEHEADVLGAKAAL